MSTTLTQNEISKAPFTQNRSRMNGEVVEDLLDHKSSSNGTSELEIMMALTKQENDFYKKLVKKYGIVIEQCRICWKIGKHLTAKCCHDKSVCSRCGVEETHLRESCFVMCFRCGEVGAEAFHDNCPKHRNEILRQALMKKFNINAKIAREVSKGRLTVNEAVKTKS